jgi:hypothetical protein
MTHAVNWLAEIRSAPNAPPIFAGMVFVISNSKYAEIPTATGYNFSIRWI